MTDIETPAQRASGPSEAAEKAEDGAELSLANHMLVLFSLSATMFMSSLDITAVATVMPVIGAQFDDLSSINWIATAYLLGTVCMLPSVGKIADIFGRPRTLMGFIAVFIAGSAICGAATSMRMLYAGRSIAGVGAAGQMVLPMAIVTELGTKRQRGTSLGIMSVVWAVSSVVGPIIGGSLGVHSSWRWVFYINAPIMGAALPLIYFSMDAPAPKGPAWERLKRIDYLGTATVVGAALCLLLALNLGGNLFAWSSGTVIILFVVSAILFGMFIFIEIRFAADPILPVHLFKTRNGGALLAMQPFFGGAAYYPIFYLMVWYSVVKAANPESSGLHLIPSLLTAALAAIISGAVITKTGKYQAIVVLSAAVAVLGCGLLILFDESISNARQIGFLIILGLGIGLSMQSHIVGIQAICTGRDMAVATASISFFRLLGAAVIIAVLNTILQSTLTANLSSVLLEHPLYYKHTMRSVNNQDILRLPALPRAVKDAIIHAFAKSLKSVFIAGTAIAGAAFPFSLFIKHVPLSTEASAPANNQFSFPKEEEKVIEFWREIDAFKTSLKLSEGRKPFSFYDGPPFATGLPHYGHLLAGTIKDIVTRYAHNTGHYVERRFGVDCHGLPIEYEIDKMLGIKGRDDVMAMGIDKYNAECRAIVLRYFNEWRKTVERLGRWIDFDNGYKTLDTPFMETEWWVFKQLFGKGLVYQGLRVMPYSTGLGTPLSNFEATQNYKDVSDPAVVVAFPLKKDPKVSLLAWTTTPWTLPSNCALCVNPDFEYIKIKDGETGEVYILLESCLGTLYKNVKKAKFEVLEKIKAQDLVGLEYEPVFDFFVPQLKETAWRVVADKYVTDSDGTGIVHNAPAFGEDDYRVCMDYKIVTPGGFVPMPVKDNGAFDDSVGKFKGLYVKDADKEIAKDIKNRGRLVRQGTLVHSYPFCWRSDTPLLYRAVPSWFVRVTDATDKLLANNAQTHWVPGFVKEKRFANWLENARDWNVSRNRYWGTPIPLWVSDDLEEIVCVGSIAELEELTGATGITDLHRDKIDHLTIPSRQGKGVLRRVEEVFDCWFESGSMPYAQKHYPFENKEVFHQTFPADFISEGIDQTRGWFYTLLVLSTLLFDKPAWKNLIASGLVLAADGKKMSKRLKNYPDPTLILDKYGADSLRLYLINSPVVRAETLKFKEEGVKDIVSRVLLPWYNAFRFFGTQVLVLKKENGVDFKFDPSNTSSNTMDRWVLASVQSLIQFVREEMGTYRLYTVVPRLLQMIDQLTNWYIRFNRKRLKGENGVEDAVHALNTLYEVLLTLCRLMAPFTPFITETMYQSLKEFLPANYFGEEDSRSLHFVPFPEVREEYFDPVIERAMSRMQAVIELGRTVREKNNISLKTPLLELVVVHPSAEYLDDVRGLSTYVAEELNLRNLVLTSDEDTYGIKYRAEADFKKLGTKLRKDMPRVKKALPDVPSSEIKAAQTSGVLVVDGITLGADDINIVRFFDALSLSGEGDKKYEEATDKDVLVLLDTAVHEELMLEGLAREVINRVQRLRKKAGLQAVDDVSYYYQITQDPEGVLAKVLSTQAEFLRRSLKQELNLLAEMKGDAFAQEEQEVSESKFILAFVR
ncbi:isoleucine--tRNA ligase [Dipsacomyces acuminosporus]|nr:isoleucine--tRNA ligase [Dipsacomyces acuminosporus]